MPYGPRLSANSWQKATKPAIPASMPRSNSIAAPLPASRWVNTARTEASTGSAASIPPASGPSAPAAADSEITSSAVAAIRGTIRSCDRRGGESRSTLTLARGNARRAARSAALAASSPIGEAVCRAETLTASAATAAAPQPAPRLARQPPRRAVRAYASAKAASAASPSSVPLAARAANAGPWPSAVISNTGPTIAGNALTTPPTRGPKRRAASVEAPASDGATPSPGWPGPARFEATGSAVYGFSATAASGVATWKLKLSSRYSRSPSASCES